MYASLDGKAVSYYVNAGQYFGAACRAADSLETEFARAELLSAVEATGNLSEITWPSGNRSRVGRSIGAVW